MSLEEVIEQLHAEHEQHYSFKLTASVELVNFHLVAEIEVDKPDFPKLENGGKALKDAIFDHRDVDFDDLGVHRTAFYHRHLLETGMRITGHAIVAEAATTTLITPMHTANIDQYGNLILTQNT